MKKSKKIAWSKFIPITFVGTGLLSASIISTSQLLGNKEPEWNRKYNESKENPVDSTKNPLAGPTNYSDFQVLPYDTWSRWISSSNSNTMVQSNGDQLMLMNFGNMFTPYSKTPAIRSLPEWGKTLRKAHHWKFNYNTRSKYGFDPKNSNSSYTQPLDGNSIQMVISGTTPVAGYEYARTGQRSASFAIGGDRRWSVGSMDWFGKDNSGKQNSSNFGTYGFHLDTSNGVSQFKATSSWNYWQNYTYNYYGQREKGGNDWTSLNNGHYIYGNRRDDYNRPDRYDSNSTDIMYLGKKGGDGYTGAIQLVLNIPLVYAFANAGNGGNGDGNAFYNSATESHYRDHVMVQLASDDYSYNRFVSTLPENSKSGNDISFRIMENELGKNSNFYIATQGWYNTASLVYTFQTNFGAQFYISYPSYNSSTPYFYFPMEGDSERSNRLRQNSYSVNKNNVYASEALANPNLAVSGALSLSYDLPSTYYLARVRASYNDDLGWIKFKISYPNLRTYDTKLYPVRDYTFSGEYEYTIKGFKANVTSFETTETNFSLPQDIGIRLVASTLIQKEMAQDWIWRAMTYGYYRDENGYWRNDKLEPDFILDNWDRIPNFVKNDLIIQKMKFNMTAGTATISIKPRTYIRYDHQGNAELSGNQNNAPFGNIVISGFQQVHERSAIRMNTVNLGGGADISEIANKTQEEGIEYLKELIHKHQMEHFGTPQAIVYPMDTLLWAKDPLQVLNYTINETQGTVDVSVVLTKVYDPKISTEDYIEIEKPVVQKIRITGYRGATSKFLETNTTTKLLADRKLISQKSYNNPQNGALPGIEINGTDIGFTNNPDQLDPKIKGFGSDIQSIYYDALLQQYVALVWNQNDGKLMVVNSDRPYDMALENSSSIKYITDTFDNQGQLASNSINSSMRMVPISNGQSTPQSYLVFPIMGSGVSENNDPVFIVSYNERGQGIVSKLPYDTFTDKPSVETGINISSIVAMGGYQNGTNSFHLTAVTVNDIGEIKFKSVDVETKRNGGEAGVSSKTYKPIIAEANSLEQDMMKYKLNDGVNIASLPEFNNNQNIMDLYTPNLVTIKRPDGTYASMWTRMKYKDETTHEPTYDVLKIEFGTNNPNAAPVTSLITKQNQMDEFNLQARGIGDFRTQLWTKADYDWTSRDLNQILYKKWNHYGLRNPSALEDVASVHVNSNYNNAYDMYPINDGNFTYEQWFGRGVVKTQIENSDLGFVARSINHSDEGKQIVNVLSNQEQRRRVLGGRFANTFAPAGTTIGSVIYTVQHANIIDVHISEDRSSLQFSIIAQSDRTGWWDSTHWHVVGPFTIDGFQGITSVRNGNITGFEETYANDNLVDDQLVFQQMIDDGLIRNIDPTTTGKDIEATTGIEKDPINGTWKFKFRIKNNKAFLPGGNKGSYVTPEFITVGGFKKSEVEEPVIEKRKTTFSERKRFKTNQIKEIGLYDENDAPINLSNITANEFLKLINQDDQSGFQKLMVKKPNLKLYIKDNKGLYDEYVKNVSISNVQVVNDDIQFTVLLSKTYIDGVLTDTPANRATFTISGFAPDLVDNNPYKFTVSNVDIFNDKNPDLNDAPTLFEDNLVNNVFASNDGTKMIYNVRAKDLSNVNFDPTPNPQPQPPNGRELILPGTSNATILKELSRDSYAVIYDIEKDKKNVVKLRDNKVNVNGAMDETRGILIPDQKYINDYYVLETNDYTYQKWPTAIEGAQKFHSNFLNNSRINIENESLYLIYEKYLADPKQFAAEYILPKLDGVMKFQGLNESLTFDQYYNNIDIGEPFFDFENSIMSVPVTMKYGFTHSLNNNPISSIVEFVYEDKPVGTVINPIVEKWEAINVVDVEETIKGLNDQTLLYEEYFKITSSLNALTDKPKIINVKTVSVNSATETAIIAVTVDKALVAVTPPVKGADGNPLPPTYEVLKNQVFEVKVQFQRNVKPIPERLNIKQNPILNGLPPSELVNKLNGNGTEQEQKQLFDALKEEIIKALGAEKILKIEDVIIKREFTHNNASGSVKIKVTIPKWCMEINEDAEYFERTVDVQGFLEFPATNVIPVSAEKRNQKFSDLENVSASGMQDYLNSSWHNIYKFVAVMNPYSENGDVPFYFPFIIGAPDEQGNVTIIDNPNYDENRAKTTTPEQLKEIAKKNTTIQGSVIKPVDNGSGKVDLNIYIKNGWSAENNANLQAKPDGTYIPIVDAVSNIEIEVTDLSISTNGVKTGFPSLITFTASDGTGLSGSLPYNILEDANKLGLLKDFVKKHGIDLPDQAEINIIKAIPNNSNGSIYLEIAPTHITKQDGKNQTVEENKDPATNKPKVIYNVEVEGFGKIANPTKVTATKNPMVHAKVYDLEKTLFKADGTVKDQDALAIILQLVSIEYAPVTDIASLIELGRVVNVNVQQKTATVKFRIKDYFADNDLLSLHHGLEVSIDVSSDSDNLYALSVETKAIGKNNQMVTTLQQTIFNDLMKQEAEWIEHQQNAKVHIAVITTSIIGLLVLAYITAYYVKYKKLSKKNN